METLVPAALGILFGLLGLLWGADRFVAGSASAAKNFGISPLVIGLTIVSIGTSAPEIIVAINAALKEAGDMAVGFCSRYFRQNSRFVPIPMNMGRQSPGDPLFPCCIYQFGYHFAVSGIIPTSTIRRD